MDTGQGVAVQDLAKGDRGTREESTQGRSLPTTAQYSSDVPTDGAR